uniref:Bm13515, isoform a n=1 Tax=Brugia malayi TaxID=6279 RepID=A0A1I9G3N9_BRUMA|nr:Bm13515, isoform a [Brugia malayi]
MRVTVLIRKNTLKVPCSRRRFNENYTLVESESPKGNELECELAA